jgi:hypothetical protein
VQGSQHLAKLIIGLSLDLQKQRYIDLVASSDSRTDGMSGVGVESQACLAQDNILWQSER